MAPSARERRPLVGTAARRAAAAQTPTGPDGAVRTGTPTSGRHASRTAARRAAAAQRDPNRSGMVPSARERRPPVGTAARSAAKGVYHAAVRMTLNAGVPAEKGPPRTWGSFSPPAFGGLCRPEVGVPLPARRSAWWHGRRDVHHQELNWPEVGVPLPARRSAWWRAAPRRAPPGTELSCPAGCAGGRDHERFSRWGFQTEESGEESGRNPGYPSGPREPFSGAFRNPGFEESGRGGVGGIRAPNPRTAPRSFPRFGASES